MTHQLKDFRITLKAEDSWYIIVVSVQRYSPNLKPITEKLDELNYRISCITKSRYVYCYTPGRISDFSNKLILDKIAQLEDTLQKAIVHEQLEGRRG